MREQELTKESSWPFWVGGGLSVLLLVGFVALVQFGETCTGDGKCITGWLRLLQLSPNEIGDMAAGIAGSLALVWIIVTVALQSKELRAQRIELGLAIEEYKRMAKAQEEQLGLMAAQAVIFQDEQRQRQEDRAKDQLDVIISSIEFYIKSLARRETSMLLGKDNFIIGSLLVVPREITLKGDHLVRDLQEYVMTFHVNYLQSDQEILSNSLFKCKSTWIVMTELMSAANSLYDQLDSAQKIRLQSLYLEGTIRVINDILNLPIWEDKK